VVRAALALASLLAGALVFPPNAGAAQFSSAFVVADLPVEATGKSGVVARDAARDAAEAQALGLLLQRLTAPQDWPRLPHLQGEDVTDLVLDFEVESEHASASHYLGRYTFRFDPKGIRDLLQQANIPFTEVVSKPVVAVPVFQDNSGTRLWDDPNPWRDAWNAAHGPAGLVPWVVPVGDLTDVQAIDVADAQHPSADKLVTMSQRYGGGDVVVASAVEQDVSVPAASPDATPAPAADANGAAAAPAAVTLQITVTRYAATGTDSETTSVSGDKANPALFLSGVIAAERMLEDMWKKVSLTAAGTGAEAVQPNSASSGGMLVGSAGKPVEVEVPIADAAGWVKIYNEIGQVSGVLGTRLEVMTKDKMLLQLSLSGEPQSLGLAFAQQDLALVPGKDGGPFVLEPRSLAGNAALVPQAAVGAAPTLLAPPQSAAPAAQTQLAPLPAQTLGTVPVPPASSKPDAGSPGATGPGGASASDP
jgi:hypothetical protein